MTDPSADVQRAIFAALRGDAQLIAWFASSAREKPAEAPRVFDRIPADPTTGRWIAAFPFLHIGGGDDQVIDDSAQCEDSAECLAPVHIWSRAVGSIEAKELAAHVIRILDDEIAITGHRVISHRISDARGVDSGDALTTHRVVTPAYVTSPL